MRGGQAAQRDLDIGPFGHVAGLGRREMIMSDPGRIIGYLRSEIEGASRAMTMPSAKPSNVSPANRGSGEIGLVAAVSIGIGGMVGAGIFAILGVGARAAGHAMSPALRLGGGGA